MRTVGKKRFSLVMALLFALTMLVSLAPGMAFASNITILNTPAVNDDIVASLGTVLFQYTAGQLKAGDTCTISLPSNFQFVTRGGKQGDLMPTVWPASGSTVGQVYGNYFIVPPYYQNEGSKNGFYDANGNVRPFFSVTMVSENQIKVTVVTTPNPSFDCYVYLYLGSIYIDSGYNGNISLTFNAPGGSGFVNGTFVAGAANVKANTSYTVTFESNGGSTVNSQSVAYNGKVTRPADPAKDGFSFGGWYSDKALTTVYDFNKAVTANVNLYAKWAASTAAPPTAPAPTPGPVPGPGQSSNGWQNPFSDVKSTDWFYSDVSYAVVNGIFNGTGATTFSPNASVTRGMFVTVLWRLAGSPAGSGGSQFSDVEQSAYYAGAVKWAAANGVVKGISNTKFAPNGLVTREQMAAILYRYEQFSGQTPSGAGAPKAFADQSKISAYAQDPVNALVAQGILGGKPGNLFDPQGTAVRAEVAAVLHRFAAAVR